MSNIDAPAALRPALAPRSGAGAGVPPLRLACYLPDLSGGGVERMRLHLLEALRDRGVETTLLLTRGGGSLDGTVPPGIRVVSFGNRRTAADLPRLAWWLRRHKPDVLLSSMGHNNVVASLGKLLAGSRAKLVVCQHNALSHEARSGGSYRVLPALLRALSPAASGIVAVSEGVADDMAACTGIRRDRITVIPNPVVTPSLAVRVAAPLDHPWFAPGAPPVFVTAGRLVPQKDHATLLRAFALHRQAHAARLLILGEGPLRAELEVEAGRLGIAADVGFEGFVANPLPYVARAAAFVLSSRHEGFGNVLVEALACGTPVISADCPHGPAEILRNGDCGVLVPPGDPVALAGALDADLRTRFPPAQSRRRAAEFSVERAAASYLAVVGVSL